MPLVNEFTPTADYAKKMTSISFRQSFSSPLPWLIFISVLICGPVLGTALGGLVGNASVGAACGVIAAVASIPCMCWFVYRQGTKRVAASIQRAGILRSGFGPDALSLGSLQGKSEIAYSAVESVEVRQGFVVIRIKGSSRKAYLPIELFPGDSVSLVRSRLQAP